MEEWKDIKNYKGLYQVSNKGRIRNTKGEILAYDTTPNGYCRVHLCKKGKAKWHTIHRLVAKAFIPNPDNLPQVNHKDEDKVNNNVENLEWCDNKYNTKYGTRNKRISNAQINNKSISQPVKCIETDIIYPSIMEAERQTGIFNTAIGKVCKGERKTAGHCHWIYIDYKERRK